MNTGLDRFSGMVVGVVQFPGSNCDQDCLDVLARYFKITTRPLWHHELNVGSLDAVLIPGGFSFGDYLRSGALAAHAPIMEYLREFAEQGGPVLGICNGFQILVESHILPGVLLHNDSLKFICRSIYLKGHRNHILSLPIAHGEGRYWISQTGYQELVRHDQIAYRYVAQTGAVDESANPNGSLDQIAGIVSKNKKVLGMMPHPERACHQLLGGSADGLLVLEDFFSRV